MTEWIEGEPPQYFRVTHVVPQDATQEEVLQVLAVAQPQLQTVSFSVDHALDTHMTEQLLHVWGVERIVQPPPTTMAEARAAFTNYCETYYNFVPPIEWHDFVGGELEPVEPQIGMHDFGGGLWLRSQGLNGFCVYSVALGETAVSLDFSGFAENRIQTVVRLNYGYSPIGTVPGADDEEAVNAFIAACRETMQQSSGVWGWVIGNEPRNPAERPGGEDGVAVSAEHYAQIYNAIYTDKPDGSRMAPAAIDTYFGVDGIDPMDFLAEMLEQITDCEFLTIHAKTQGSVPSQVASSERFTAPPLDGRYLNFRTYRDVIDHLPQTLVNRPIIITEANPQRHGAGGEDDIFGWEAVYSAEWIRAAHEEIRQWNQRGRNQIIGIVFYRWDFDAWALANRPNALLAIGELPHIV